MIKINIGLKSVENWLAKKWPVAYQLRYHKTILDALMGYPEDILAIKGEIYCFYNE